jgi:hypothetical protein
MTAFPVNVPRKEHIGGSQGMPDVMTSWSGQSIERVEYAELLAGRGRFIDDLVETTSPFTSLGTKSVGECNCMNTPVCLANAVANAFGLVKVNLPFTP